MPGRALVRSRSIVAEFVIVVLGVLVALAADSAVERRRERAAAYEALAAIRRDVAADAAQLEGRIRNQVERGQQARARLELFLTSGSEIVDSVQFLRDIDRVSFYQTFDPNTAAMEGLVNSGKLELIESPQLRSAILEYQNDVEDIIRFEGPARAASLQLEARLLPQLVSGLVLSTYRDVIMRGSDLETVRSVAARSLDSDRIRRSDALRELLVSTARFFNAQRGQYGGALNEANNLVEMLDVVLNDR